MGEWKLIQKAESFGTGLRVIAVIVLLLGVGSGLAVIVSSGPSSGSVGHLGQWVGAIVGGSILAGSLLVAGVLAWAGYVLEVLAAIWRRTAGYPPE
jgi:hypothetical protein